MGDAVMLSLSINPYSSALSNGVKNRIEPIVNFSVAAYISTFSLLVLLEEAESVPISTFVLPYTAPAVGLTKFTSTPIATVSFSKAM